MHGPRNIKPRLQFLHTCYLHQSISFPNIWNLPPFQRIFQIFCNFILLSVDVIRTQLSYIKYFEFTSEPATLLTINTTSMYFFTRNLCSTSESTPSTQTCKSWWVPFTSNPSWFSWAFLLEHSQVRFIRNDKVVSLHKISLNRKRARQMFSYADFTIGLIQTDGAITPIRNRRVLLIFTD